MTAEIDIQTPIQRGDSFAFEFNWTDGNESSPEPIDMRGSTVYLSFKASPFIPDEEASVLIEYEVPLDLPFEDRGKVVVNVPRSESQKLIAGMSMHYALRVITPAPIEGLEGVELTHVKGRVPIEDA